MEGFFGSKSVRILSLVLLAQAGAFYGFSRSEKVPTRRPLAEFSIDDTSWKNMEDTQIDQETLDVLKADDILSRVYQNTSNGQVATLFIAYFDTQRTGKAPHSPKNCLPGAGWVQDQASIVDLEVPGQTEPVNLNRYIVSRGDNKSVVFYWYQSHNRTIASEFTAKFYTIADSIRYNRSDTALVRVVVGVSGNDTQTAIKTGTDFIKAFFTPLKQQLPA
jgi:EpsI family protein